MNTPPLDLNGYWVDVNALGSPEITINHDLSTNVVRAEYMRPRPCTDCDGTVLEETKIDFEGVLQRNRLNGKIKVCNFGSVPVKGWVWERLELTVDPDGRKLSGQYFCSVDKNCMTVTFLRKICPRPARSSSLRQT